MANLCERKIIKIAEAEIEKFAKEWAKTPYAWESEADIHAELYMRIKSHVNKKYPPAEHKSCWKENGKIELFKEVFDWVYCKPKTYIKAMNNCCYPDLAIYKEKTSGHPIKERENEPMLWVCEIKYITDWSSLLSIESIENDIKKLTQLLNQKKDGTEYACYLIFRRNITFNKNIEKIFKVMDKKIKFRHYEVGDEK